MPSRPYTGGRLFGSSLKLTSVHWTSPWWWNRSSNFLLKNNCLHLKKPFFLFRDTKGYPTSSQLVLIQSVDTVAIYRGGFLTVQNRKGIQVERAVNDRRQMWEEDVGERTFCIVYLWVTGAWLTMLFWFEGMTCILTQSKIDTMPYQRMLLN